MYTKRQKRSLDIMPWAIASLLLALLVGIGYIVYSRMQSSSNTTSTQTEEQAGGGTVKVLATLDTGDQETTGATPNITEAVETKTTTAELPAGWVEQSSETLTDYCGTERSVEKKIYRNGSITMTLFRGGKPNECDPAAVGDTELPITKNDTSYKVDLSSIPQCTKDQNPNCPKGDGKVTLYAGLATTAYSSTDYFFVVEEPAVEPDFATQVTRLASSIEAVQIR